jgi:N-acetylneuraminic acid mutarotase
VIAGHLPAALSHASAVTLDGTIYLIGGRVQGAASGRIFRFDPTGNRVLPAGHLPRPVYDGAAGTYRGRAYVVGGLGSGGAALDKVMVLSAAPSRARSR